MTLYRVGIDGITHREAFIPNRQQRGCWTPMCQPDDDWLILKDSEVEGPPTCLWCIAHARFR